MFTDILKTKFLSTLRTGNHAIDMILSAAIFTIVARMAKYRNNIYNYFIYIFKYYLFNKNNELNFYAIEHIKESCMGNLVERKIYPTSILSLIFYINNFCNIKKDINSKREITKSGMNVVRSHNRFDYDDIQENISSDLIVYSIDQEDYFMLSEDIKCLIEIVEPEYDTNGTSEGKSKGYTRHIKYKIYSDNLSINYLETFMNKCVMDYKKYTKDLTRLNQYYFTFKEIDDNIIVFDEYNFTSNRSFNNIYFEEKDNIIQQLDFFLNNKEWYDNHGIPHTLGLLLHGVPGCGKTSTIKAIANKTRRHILDIPLSRIKTYHELMTVFNCFEINQKDIPIDQRIYVFEDFDCLSDIVKKRNQKKDFKKDVQKDNKFDQNQEKLDKIINHINSDDNKTFSLYKNDKDELLTLSHILNVFDGILEMPGRIIIITSNFPDKIDEALLRPGRIYRKIEFKKSSSKILKQIISDFYTSSLNNRLFTDDEEKIITNNNFKHTPAEFIQLCIKYKESFPNLINYLNK